MTGTSQTVPLMQKFQGVLSMWVVWANRWFDVLKFFPFSGLFNAATGRIFARTPNVKHANSIAPRKTVTVLTLDQYHSVGFHSTVGIYFIKTTAHLTKEIQMPSKATYKLLTFQA